VPIKMKNLLKIVKAIKRKNLKDEFKLSAIVTD